MTSPGGTAEAGIGVMGSTKVNETLEQTVSAAGRRSRELAILFGEDQ